MKVKSKIWTMGFLILVSVTLTVVGSAVVKIDPFFHYRAPDINTYYYRLDNQRSQNDGISKYFKYDALITGTSVTENFKTSEMDELFGTHSIKVPYSGGSYKEINDNLINALNNNQDLRIIVRGLDMHMFLNRSDVMRSDLGEYPTYLYDNNIFNDVKYIFNRDVVFNRVYQMVRDKNSDDFTPGITSFDDYSYWPANHAYGINTVLSDPSDISNSGPKEAVHLTDAEREIISENIYQNVTSLAEAYPEVTFYYFLPPCSALWWYGLVNNGTIYKQIEAEEYIIETILQVDNIRLYSFNNRTDITTDLNNYFDIMHYGPWVNSLILRWICDEEYLLTWDNYEDYLAQELSFYTSYDYSQLAEQEDYDNNFYAAALLNAELHDVTPIKYTEEMVQSISNAGRAELKLAVDDISDYQYLVFYGEKRSEQEWPAASVYTENGDKLTEVTAAYYNTDDEWQQYLLDVSGIEGAVTIILNDEYSDITLY